MHHDPVPLTYISRFTDLVEYYVESRKFYVESRSKVHFSAVVIAVSIKHCTVIVFDTLFKHAHGPMPLTNISRSIDSVSFFVETRKFYVESRTKVHFSAAVIALSMKHGIVIVLDRLFKHAP